MKKFVAEFIGSFGLVFFGTGAIIVNELTQGIIGHVGISITFGLIIMVMIYAFGHVSGAHFNPAVTIGFAVAGLFNKKDILIYIVSQIAGAFCASVVLKYLFPDSHTLGATIPSGNELQSFIIEFILTYFLMIVIINVSHGAKEIGILAGIAIGGTILLEALFAGPISGASMNPARSIAPAMVSGNTKSLWIYLIAPILGAIAATLTWKGMNKKAIL